MESSDGYKQTFRRWSSEQPLRATEPVGFDAQAEKDAISTAQREREARKARKS